MDPIFSINNWPGCRGDCRQGRGVCPCPKECDPDSPPLTRNGCMVAIALSILAWVAVIIVGALVVRIL